MNKLKNLLKQIHSIDSITIMYLFANVVTGLAFHFIGIESILIVVLLAGIVCVYTILYTAILVVLYYPFKQKRRNKNDR